MLKKVRNALPILGWAVPYDWRENLAGDVIAGVTLAVMQVLSGNLLLIRIASGSKYLTLYVRHIL